MRTGKLVIAEGGGPTAVINHSLVGAILEARLFPQIERVYGARYGVRGIVDEDFVDLSMETRANLEAVAATPSSALGSTRDKPDVAYCRGIFATLRAHGAAWFLYIGGNDTAESTPRASEPQIPSKCSSPPWLDRPRRPAAPTRRACAADRGG